MDEATLTKAILKTWNLDSFRPRYITAVQVNNGAGFAYGRTIDAIVFDTWPSSGLHFHGLEIKVTKTDLRRELQNTQKFAEFAPYLDLFSIVAPKGIADLKLLPPKWGLYVMTDEGTLRARRKPLMLHDEGKRKTISRTMSAAFARALVVRSLSNEATIAAYEDGMESGKNELAYELKVANKTLESLRDTVAAFEKESGITIVSWRGKEIGQIVHMILNGGLERKIRYAPNVRKLGEQMLKLADEMDELQEALK